MTITNNDPRVTKPLRIHKLQTILIPDENNILEVLEQLKEAVETLAQLRGAIPIQAANMQDLVDLGLITIRENGEVQNNNIMPHLQEMGVIEPWNEVTSFGGTWGNYGTPYDTLAYCKTASGVVYIKGAIKSGTSGTTVFTLPIGYRPDATIGFSVADNTPITSAGSAYITIDSTGVVTAFANNTTWVTMNVSFRV